MPNPNPVVEPEVEATAQPAEAEAGGADGNTMLRFTLVTGAWFVGLFGLMRLPWVERTLLTPFAKVQQGVADQLTGAPSDLVYADASCSGGDPLALCAGAIFAFPATWGARLRGAAVGFTLITAFNVVRLGHLSLIAENRELLDLLHVLRLARHPDPGRGGVRLRLDGPAGLRRRRQRRRGRGGVVRRRGARGRGAALPAAGGGPGGGVLRHGAVLLRERVRRRRRGLDRGGGRRDPGCGRDDGRGLGGGDPHRARSVRRHAGVHLHAAHPALRGGGAGGADGLASADRDAGGDAGRLLRPRRLAAAGPGRPR